jgi:toxin ParE1/3/4
VSQDDTPQRKVSIRPRAIADIEKCADYLEENATPKVALRFRSAIMQAVEQIEAMPGVGSPRQVRNPRLSGLRMWIVPGFQNYLLFYLTPQGGAEIIRLFHGAQEVNSILETEE